MTALDIYDYKEHLHRYGVWTAARAQRAFMTTAHIKQALDKIDLKREAFGLSMDMDASAFDEWHVKICNNLQSELRIISTESYKPKKGKKVEFGRAAKIVNIYLKTTVVIPNCEKDDCNLIQVIHPPIDAILLKCLANCERKILSKEQGLITWTNMKQEVYTSIIDKLREHFQQSSLWKAEACWKPEKEVSTKQL